MVYISKYTPSGTFRSNGDRSGRQAAFGPDIWHSRSTRGQLQVSGSKADGGAVAGGLAQLARGPFCRKCAGCSAGLEFSTLPKFQ